MEMISVNNLRPTYYIDSDASEVIAFARDAAGDRKTSIEKA